MRTTVYIDGFNLYNRRLKYSPAIKWLNLTALCDTILRAPMVVQQVNYYTARVSGKIDRGAPARQQAYLDALGTVPEIKIHYGNFMFTKRWAALGKPPRAKPPTYVWPSTLPDLVWVEKAEEKGSDVNLASHLVRDADSNAFDVAVIVTNDTDLVEPMRIASIEAGKTVGLLTPIARAKKVGHWAGAHTSLVAVASWTLYIHDKHFRSSQFPSPLGAAGIVRPTTWV